MTWEIIFCNIKGLQGMIPVDHSRCPICGDSFRRGNSKGFYDHTLSVKY